MTYHSNKNCMRRTVLKVKKLLVKRKLWTQKSFRISL